VVGLWSFSFCVGSDYIVRMTILSERALSNDFSGPHYVLLPLEKLVKLLATFVPPFVLPTWTFDSMSQCRDSCYFGVECRGSCYLSVECTVHSRNMSLYTLHSSNMSLYRGSCYLSVECRDSRYFEL
jgi:hypothetical protein